MIILAIRIYQQKKTFRTVFISVDGWDSSWLLKLLREICKVLPLSVFVIAFFWFLISTDYVYRFTGRILYRATCFFFFLPSEFCAGATSFYI